MDIFLVFLTKQAEKDLKRIPDHVRAKLAFWIDAVEHEGLRTVRKSPGYHDEPLKGDRRGERSIRLNKAYRAIYIIGKYNEIEIVEIIEVTKHKY